MPWGVSFLVLSIWYFCASYIWVSITFLHFRKFKFSSMILLKSRSMPLTWNSSSSMSTKGPGYSFFQKKKKKSVSLRSPTPLAWLQALIFCLLPDWFCWYGFPVRFFIEWLIFFYYHHCFNLDLLQSNLFDEFTFHILNEWGLRTGRRAEPRCLKARVRVSSCLGKVLRQVAWEGGAKATSYQHR